MLSPAAEEAWTRYLAAETTGVRSNAMALLERFIAQWAQEPEDVRVAWARALACAAVDNHAQVPVRLPLFQVVLLPTLCAGVVEEVPGCARWLAGFARFFSKAPVATLPPHLQHAYGLLCEALRVDETDVRARGALVTLLGDGLAYALHEVPAGVLFGADGATQDQCDALLAELAELRMHVTVLKKDAEYGAWLDAAEVHFKAYRDYRCTQQHNESYAAYLTRRQLPLNAPKRPRL